MRSSRLKGRAYAKAPPLSAFIPTRHSAGATAFCSCPTAGRRSAWRELPKPVKPASLNRRKAEVKAWAGTPPAGRQSRQARSPGRTDRRTDLPGSHGEHGGLPAGEGRQGAHRGGAQAAFGGRVKSGPSWTVIPAEAGQRFQGKPDTDSRAIWTARSHNVGLGITVAPPAILPRTTWPIAGYPCARFLKFCGCPLRTVAATAKLPGQSLPHRPRPERFSVGRNWPDWPIRCRPACLIPFLIQ